MSAMIRTLAILFGGCLLLPIAGTGQSVKKDLTLVNKQYESTPHFTQDITYLVYNDHKSSQPDVQMEGMAVKAGQKNYSKTGPNELISNGTYYLIIDHENQMMVVDHDQRQAPRFMEMALDSALLLCKKISTINETEHSRTHRFEFDDREYTTLELTLDTKHWWITKIRMVYKEVLNPELGQMLQPMLVMNYRNMKTQLPANHQQLFSEKTYVTIADDGMITPKPAYKHYQLVTPQLNLSDQ